MHNSLLFDDPEEQDEDEFENRLIDVDCLLEYEIELLASHENVTLKLMEW